MEGLKSKNRFIYLDETTGYSMATLLVFFMTGSMIFDPQEDLQVLFNTDPKKVLLEADSCFDRIVIPTSHNTYEEFAKAFKSSVIFGAEGYGRF